LKVQTEAGWVEGAGQGTVDAFLGIPYAASTGGPNRWRAPQPAAPWNGVRQAKAFGPNCAQEPPYMPPGGTPWTDEYLPSGASSEDCLSLNVWTPANSRKGHLPVMVWIHGGGFLGGSGSVPIYNGAKLATQGIVVVTINYRVGVLGFLAHPWLTAEAGTSGNYGLMDQVAALQWVKRNIATFGGDPRRVTVAGQSAGAASVHYLMAAPSAAGLFTQAIAESGSGMGLQVPTLAEAESLGGKIVAASGAHDLVSLRALPAETVIRAMRNPAAGPPGTRTSVTQDGRFLSNPEAERSDIPVLTGLNADENSTGYADRSTVNQATLAGTAQALFGSEASRFLTFYANFSPADATRQMLRDRGIAAMTNWYESRPAHAAPVYGYLFSHVEPGPMADRFQVFHSSEIPYAFGTLDTAPRPFIATDRKLSAEMVLYWASFVRSGRPFAPGIPEWPALATQKIMIFGDGALQPKLALTPAKAEAFRDFVRAGGKIAMFERE
jgi:para-nitrobenzyl esterase